MMKSFELITVVTAPDDVQRALDTALLRDSVRNVQQKRTEHADLVRLTPERREVAVDILDDTIIPSRCGNAVGKDAAAGDHPLAIVEGIGLEPTMPATVSGATPCIPATCRSRQARAART